MEAARREGGADPGNRGAWGEVAPGPGIRGAVDSRAASGGPPAASAFLGHEAERFFANSMDMQAVAGLDGRFHRVNPAWTETLGWTEEELTSVPYLDFVHPEDVPATLERAARLAAGATVIHFENRYRTRGGEYRWLSWRARPDRPGGDVIYASARDITDRRAAEEELRRAKEAAEEASRELDAFSYSVSHDLRAPLRSIHGFAEAILEDEAGRLSPTAEAHFRRIQAAAQRMGMLVDDLLRLSRVTRADLHVDPVDLGRLAEAAAAELRAAHPDRAVDFAVRGDLSASGDARLLRVVLDNLLANAWKFTAGRNPARVEFAEEAAAGERRFVVRDDGAGFDMAHAGRLFGTFQRLHPASEFPGTGIGLATVARIVQRHGGRVGAEAAPGAGAAIWFTLPDRSEGASRGI